jgi:signal transduction histidine kinase/CheY-like chemotaxis protein
VDQELRDRIVLKSLDVSLPVMTAATFLLFGLYVALVPEQWQRLMPLGVLAIASSAGWLFRRARRPRPALMALAIGTGAAICLGMWLNGGVRTPAYHATVVLVVLVAAWQGWRHLLATVVGVVLLGAFFLAAEELGWIAGPRTLPPAAVWASVSTFVIVTAGLAYIPVSLLEKALDRVEKDGAELLRARERLNQADKLESLGRLAGGVAHDFNNALGGILGSVELLRQEFPGVASPRQREFLDLIRDSANRAADLTRSLLLHARRVPMELKPLDLDRVAKSAMTLLGAGLNRRITLELKLEASRATVLGSASHLEHALLNLGANARDAIAGSGRVTLRTFVATLTGSETDLVPGPLPPGAYAALSVEDDGSGIEPGLRARLFEPFFTTKEVGKGTGLGLPGVLGTAQAHGGAVRVESEPGRGSRFTILLPLRRDVDPETPPPPAAPVGTGSGRVLLVDDEEGLRALGSRVLGDSGFTVEVAADGAQGLLAAKSAPGAYDLAFVDLMMPVMNGRELIGELRKVDPGLPVVVMTGYLEPEIRTELDRLGVARVLEKPFGPGVLRAAAGACRRARRESGT